MAEAEVDAGAATLERQIATLRNQLRRIMRERFDRDLPLDELLSDRWERARELGFGEGTSIYASSYVYGDVQVGSHTWIGPFTILDGSGGPLRIGNRSDVSAGVQIYTHDSVRRAVSGGRVELDRGAVSIGDRCHIGPLTVITRGVTIGPQCVIGAGSFVNRDVEANSVAVGTPCRRIGTVVVDPDGNVRLAYDREGAEQVPEV